MSRVILCRNEIEEKNSYSYYFPSEDVLVVVI